MIHHEFRTVAFLVVLPWCLSAALSAGDLSFLPPQFLPGDAVSGPSVGMQIEADIARGGDHSLAVWCDYRSSPDDYPPFASEGSGADIYAARLDASGNVIDTEAILVRQDLGDQVEPRVAWNGQNWLVVWKQSTVALPTYEMLEAVRVAPDGTVLDPSPFVLHDNQSFYSDAVVEGGNGEWVVLFQVNGPADGLFAVRVSGAGTVLNPGGLQLHSTLFDLEFDLAFAQDEYLIAWGGTFDSPRGRLFTPGLQALGASFSLPFIERLATDGTDFLVVWASGSPPGATIRAVRVTHDGQQPDLPFILFTGGNQVWTCCADVTWDGNYYWASWGGPLLARVTAAGQVLDPGGVAVTPDTAPVSTPRFAAAPGGGVQMIWNDGVTGADSPKDVYTGQVLTPGQVDRQNLVSSSVPAQLDADLAEGAGTHLLVYLGRDSGTGRILARRFDSRGVVLDAEPIEVASGPIPGLSVPSLGAPAVAWNGSLFMITWSDGIGIFARRMLADGTFVDATPLTVMNGFDPDVAAVGSVFLVVGIDFLLDNPQWQATHSMRVDGVTGANLDAVPNALGGFVIFAQHPRVVSWGGRWLATWQTNRSHDDPVAGTKAAFVDPDGTTPGVITVPLGWRPDVAVADDVALFVAVTDSIASATTDLAGVIMAADGTFPGPSFLISDALDQQLQPAVTWSGSSFIVAWEDKRNSVIYFDERSDLFGARVARDGTVLDPGGMALAAASAPEIRPALVSVGGKTFLAASHFRSEAPFRSYRLALQAGVEAPWMDLGLGLAGTHGTPQLSGQGTLDAGTPVTLSLTGARASTPGFLVLGLSAWNLPFAGGTWIPSLDLMLRVPTDASGGWALSVVWPAGVPGGTGLYFQHWTLDPAAVQGLAASNGLLATTP